MTSMVTSYLNKSEENIKEIKDDNIQSVGTNDSGTTGQAEEVEDPTETNNTMLGTSDETFEEPKKESKFINLK